ncbi:MAG TPA: NYN domain-containing protein [Negativicutes bacterium]|nr:NYN domain-containing protein [Negativicutes bacterium]
MIPKENNFAYIDGANLHQGIIGFGWKLDYKKFRIWLAEKYGVKHAYIFIGLIPKYKDLYKYLQECGFTLVFKEVIYNREGRAKGNCDADLVLQAACDYYENKFDKAIIVSSDGDYASLIKFLSEKERLKTVLSPHSKDLCSILLKRLNVPIAYLSDQKSILQAIKEKTPDKDGTL